MFSIAPIIGFYFLIGIIFGLAFIIKGCVAIEPASKNSNFRVRLLILPAGVALWPLLLAKWISSRKAS